MGIVDENFTFYFRHVVRVRNTTVLPSPCYRFTGSGDRPCEHTHTPLAYALAPWAYPARVNSMLLFWSWSLLDVSNPYVFVDMVPRPHVLRDHAWVEVVRYAERTSYVGSDGAGYGVWFFLVPGSGVMVNIGRAIRFDNKLQAIDWSVKTATNTTLACASTGMASCTTHDDTYFCAAARLKGYDSMLAWRDNAYPGSPHYSGRRSDMVELIVCPAEEPPEQRTACPPLAFRSAEGGRCTCSQDSEILTCIESGDFGRVPRADDYGTRPLMIGGIFFGVWGIAMLVACVLAVRMRTICCSGTGTRRKRQPSPPESSTPLLQPLPDMSSLS